MIKSLFKPAVANAALGTLAGCIDDDMADSGPNLEAGPKAACRAAGISPKGESDVWVTSSEFSQAGTLVTRMVGTPRAPWRCIGYADGLTGGSTGGVEYLGSNG